MWLAALGAAAVIVGLLPWAIDHAQSAGSSAAVASVEPAGSTPPYVVARPMRMRSAAVKPVGRSPAAGRPLRVLMPRLHMNAPVLPIDATGRVLLPPSNPQELGWWRRGAVPGAAHGGALITGHTVHSGGGAFDDLETVTPGDPVTVRTHRGRVRYRVTGVTVYRKALLAEDATRVFRQDGPGRLVLVTCEDWNGVTYLSNAVVFADRV